MRESDIQDKSSQEKTNQNHYNTYASNISYNSTSHDYGTFNAGNSSNDKNSTGKPFSNHQSFQNSKSLKKARSITSKDGADSDYQPGQMPAERVAPQNASDNCSAGPANYAGRGMMAKSYEFQQQQQQHHLQQQQTSQSTQKTFSSSNCTSIS